MSVPRRPLRPLASAAAVALIAGALFAGPMGSGAAGARSVPRQSTRFAREVAALAGDAPYHAFVHFGEGTAAERAAFLDARGLDVVADLGSVDVALAAGEVADFEGLADEPAITYLEADQAITFAGESAVWATRARIAQEPVGGGPYLDPSGAILDGNGIGVAVVDTGILASHPDLINRVAGNFRWVCKISADRIATGPPLNLTVQPVGLGSPAGCVFVPVVDSDTNGGHGTHVAGIVAGDGTASNGMFKGVAPGADLYGFGVGAVPGSNSIVGPSLAFDHIVQNFDDRTVFPTPIRVVTNSWGSAGAFDPDGAISKLTDELVQAGVTVLFAAGNDGGTGMSDNTSSHCKHPTPGVLCVANYDDGAGGDRDLALSVLSSRGLSGQGATYPDLGAPGMAITAACLATVQPTCLVPELRWAPFYSRLSGTSMATPHVAGIVALLYQADPTLTPAEIEDVLQDTAFKPAFGAPYEADPQNSGGTHAFDKGAGIVDTRAALDALGITGGTVDQGPFTLVTDPVLDFAGVGSADIVSLTAAEEATGMRYMLTVRDAAELGPFPTMFRFFQGVDGRRVTTLELTASGVRVPARDSTVNSAVASDVVLSGNTISFLLSFPELGNPGINEVAHGIQVQSWGSAIVADAAPGGSFEESAVVPQLGTEYTIHPI